MDTQELLRMAEEARQQAYAPYSDFSVGAALRCDDGSVFFGANVENSSYGLSICAERVAIFKAVTAGRRHFTEIAIVSGGEKEAFPCGACLQVMAEFAPELELVVTVANKRLDWQSYSLSELLPLAFHM